VAERSELKAFFDTSIWTPINEGLPHKILRVSILQQQSPPLNVVSTTRLITDIAFPQTNKSALLRDARFGSLVFSESTNREDTASNNGSKDVQALFKLLHAAQAEGSTILAATVQIVSQ
jgi:hypothetical protein